MIINKTLLKALVLSVVLVGSASAQSEQGVASNFLIVGYLSEDRFDVYPIKEVENRGAAAMLTHLMYAFASVANGRPVLSDADTAYREPYGARASVDGKPDSTAEGKTLRGAFNQLRKLKILHPQLKVLISIGGSSQRSSKGFSLASRTAAARRKFVAACIDLFIRGNLPQGVSAKGIFDGIDVDWEFPTDCSAGMKGGTGCVPADTVNFTLLLSEFRRQLDEEGRKDGNHYQLTVATSAWSDDFSKYELGKIHPLLDFVNLMTYGLVLPGKTRPHAPLYKSSGEAGRLVATFNTDYAVQHYLAAGVPAKKIVMGVPFYGLGWEGVANVNKGLYQKAGRALHDEGYNHLKNLKGFRMFRDPETNALWLFNSHAGVFWSFDDPVSLAIKMSYVRRMQLGGVMFWELSGDDQESSLLKAIYDGLRQ